ncbi:hypothetical protein WA026_018966 [Henosepilachna vigintioctopunctata]|uniref:Uncharacterized protein n=1 Tax=Henosepilachna vigintioctopunctata TaxID=420089 RepID=A0AAW1UGH6_9CUCU
MLHRNPKPQNNGSTSDYTNIASKYAREMHFADWWSSGENTLRTATMGHRVINADSHRGNKRELRRSERTRQRSNPKDHIIYERLDVLLAEKRCTDH